MLQKFIKNQKGATAIEYGLIIAAMGLALITVMPIVENALTQQFSSLGSHIASGQ